MILNNSIILSKPNGGAFGFVPDWSKMVAITAPYTVAKTGFFIGAYGLNDFTVVINGVSYSCFGNIITSVPVFVGDVISVVPQYAFYVPASSVKIGRIDVGAAVELPAGSVMPSTGAVVFVPSSSTQAASSAIINGKEVAPLGTPNLSPIYISKGATVSASNPAWIDHLIFYPFKS